MKFSDSKLWNIFTNLIHFSENSYPYGISFNGIVMVVGNKNLNVPVISANDYAEMLDRRWDL